MRLYLLSSFLILSLSVSSQNLVDSQKKLNKYTILAKNFFDMGKLDSSVIYYDKAIKIASQIPDSINLTVLLREQAKALELVGDFSASLSTYLNAINYANRTNQLHELGLCHLGLSNVNYRIYNTEWALSNSIEASRIFKQLKDTSNYIDASVLMAQVYLGLEKNMDALATITDVFELAKKSNDSLQWANTLNIIGAVYSFQANYDTALIYFQQAAEMNRKLGNTISEAINLGNIGEMQMRKGQLEQAIISLFQALEMEQKLNLNSGIIFLYYTLGETYSKLNRDAKAIIFFNKSLALIDKIGEIREKPIVFNLIAEHYARNENYKKAYTYQKNYTTTKDSLNKLTALFKIEEVKAKYEIDKKEHEFQILLNEKSAQEKQLVSNKNLIKLQLIVILLVLIGLILSFVFTVYFFKSRKKLKSINKTKDILFSIIGHDLRGPMGNIKQMVDSLQSADFAERDKYIKMLQQPAEASFILLDDLLSWSRTLDNKMVYNPRLISVYDTINKTLDLLKPQAEKKGINLLSTIPSNILVFAEYNHFSTIMRNLVANAIKFTPQHGTISISHAYGTKWVKILVSDTGIGIEAQNIKKILDTNTFFTTFGTNNEKGSGLGLVLCQIFIKRNGGTFGIESTLGKGSTFYFTLPNSSQ